MSIAAIRVGSPASLDTLTRAMLDDPGAPGAGEVRVRLQASSLNYHAINLDCPMSERTPGDQIGSQKSSGTPLCRWPPPNAQALH